MKTIKYTLNGSEVSMTWNERNEEIASIEADNGQYTIEDEKEINND